MRKAQLRCRASAVCVVLRALQCGLCYRYFRIVTETRHTLLPRASDGDGVHALAAELRKLGAKS